MCRIEYVVNGQKHVFTDLSPDLQKQLNKLLKRFTPQKFSAFLTKLDVKEL